MQVYTAFFSIRTQEKSYLMVKGEIGHNCNLTIMRVHEEINWKFLAT